MSTTDIQEYRLRFSGDDGGFNKTADAVERRLTTLEGKFAATAASVGAFDTAMLGSISVMSGMGAAATSLSTALNALKSALTQTSVSTYNRNMAALATALAAVTTALPAFTAAINTSAVALNNFNIQVGMAHANLNALLATMRGIRAVSNLNINVRQSGGAGNASNLVGGSRSYSNLRSAGAAISATGMAMVGLSLYAGKQAAELDASLAKLQSFAGASKSEVDALRVVFMHLGSELGIMPKTLSDSYFYIRSMGYKGTESIDMLTYATKLSVAGMGDLKDIVKTFDSTHLMFGTPIKALSDMTAKAVTLSQADPSAFLKNMGQALAPARALNLQLKDIYSLVAIMTREGLSAPKAFQRIQAFSDTLAKPSPTQLKAMKAVGIDPGQLRKELSESVTGALLDIQKKAGNNLSLMKTILGSRRGGDPLLAMISPNAAPNNRELAKQMANVSGGTDTAYAAAADTVKNHWERAFSAATSAAIGFGEATKGQAKDVADRVREAMDKLIALPDATKKKIADFGLVGGATAVVLGTVIRLIPAFSALAGIIGSIGAGPLLAVAAAGALIFYTIKNNVGGSQKAFADLGKSALKLGENLYATLVGTWEKIGPGVIEDIGKVLTAIATLTKFQIDNMNAVFDLMKGVTTAAQVAYLEASTWFQQLGNSIEATFDRVIAKILHGAATLAFALGINSGDLDASGAVFARNANSLDDANKDLAEKSNNKRLKLLTQNAIDYAGVGGKGKGKAAFDSTYQNAKDLLAGLRSMLMGKKDPELDQSQSPLLGGKGKATPEPPQEKMADKLASKLRELSVAWHTVEDESEASKTKQELLYGSLSENADKVKSATDRLKEYKNTLKDLASLFGGSAGMKIAQNEAANALFPGRSYASLNSNNQRRANVYAVSTRVAENKDSEKAEKEYQKALNERITSNRKWSLSIDRVLAEYQRKINDLQTKRLGEDPKQNFINDAVSQHADKYQEIMEKNPGIQGIMMARQAQDSIAKLAGTQYNEQELDAARKRTNEVVSATSKWNTELQKVLNNLDLAASGKTAITQSDRRNQFVKSTLEANSGLFDRIMKDNPYDGIQMAQDASGDIADKAKKTFDTKETADYQDHYTKTIAETNKQLDAYYKKTNDAKVASVQFNEEGVQVMSNDQAKLVVALQKSIEKIKQFNDEMAGIASKAANTFTGVLSDIFDNGFKGLYRKVVQQVKQMLQSIVLELVKSKIDSYFKNLLKAPDSRSKTSSSNGGASDVMSLVMGGTRGASVSGGGGGLSSFLKLGTSLFGAFGKSGGGGGGSNQYSFDPSTLPFKLFANGGPTTFGEPIVVGDGGNGSGAEIITPRHSSTVTPVSSTSRSEEHHHYPITVNVMGGGTSRATATQIASETARQMQQRHGRTK